MTQYVDVSCRQVESGYEVCAGGRVVHLPTVPAKILMFFLENPHTTHLLRNVIAGVYAGDPRLQPFSACRATKIQIGVLRQKMQDGGLFFDLWTEPYRGYAYRGTSLIDGWEACDKRPKVRKPVAINDPVYTTPADNSTANGADPSWTFPAYRGRKIKQATRKSYPEPPSK